MCFIYGLVIKKISFHWLLKGLGFVVRVAVRLFDNIIFVLYMHIAGEAEQVTIAEKFPTSSQPNHVFIFIPTTEKLWFQITGTY